MDARLDRRAGIQTRVMARAMRSPTGGGRGLQAARRQSGCFRSLRCGLESAAGDRHGEHVDQRYHQDIDFGRGVLDSGVHDDLLIENGVREVSGDGGFDQDKRCEGGCGNDFFHFAIPEFEMTESYASKPNKGQLGGSNRRIFRYRVAKLH